MPVMTDELSLPPTSPVRQTVHVDLSKADLALIIDALLQAEMTLPLIDRRHQAMQTIGALRASQISLADRLEDLMADPGGELARIKSRS